MVQMDHDTSRLQSCPKVELHVHLDGAFDPALLYEAAQERLAAGALSAASASQVAGCKSADDFASLVACTSEEKSLAAMIDRFVFFLPFVQGNLAALEALAYQFVARQAAQNVLHTELRYSPHILTRAGKYDAGQAQAAYGDVAEQAKAVVEAVTRGLCRGTAEFPDAEVVQILCFIDGRPDWAESLASLAAEGAGRSCPIVAVDIAAGESHFGDGGAAFGTQSEAMPPAGQEWARRGNGGAHRAGMCRCAALGLGLTNHAGESGPAENVAAALSDSYGRARRVGHGYAAVSEALSLANQGGSGTRATPAAVAAAFERVLGVSGGEVTFECCPTSSRATSGWTGADWADHPIAVLHRLRAEAEASGDSAAAAALPRPTISSDDPAVFLHSLSEEYELVSVQMGLGVTALRQLTANAVDAAFLDAKAKERLRARVDVAWERWLAGSDQV